MKTDNVHVNKEVFEGVIRSHDHFISRLALAHIADIEIGICYEKIERVCRFDLLNFLNDFVWDSIFRRNSIITNDPQNYYETIYEFYHKWIHNIDEIDDNVTREFAVKMCKYYESLDSENPDLDNVEQFVSDIYEEYSHTDFFKNNTQANSLLVEFDYSIFTSFHREARRFARYTIRKMFFQGRLSFHKILTDCWELLCDCEYDKIDKFNIQYNDSVLDPMLKLRLEVCDCE